MLLYKIGCNNESLCLVHRQALIKGGDDIMLILILCRALYHFDVDIVEKSWKMFVKLSY